MGKIKLSLLLVSTLLLAVIFSSCAAEKPEPVEITVKVSISYKNEKLIDKQSLVLTSEDGTPLTVLDAVKRVCDIFEYSLKLTDDGLSVVGIAGKEDAGTSFWLWSINGQEPEAGEGKAGEYEIKNGDEILYFFEVNGVSG